MIQSTKQRGNGSVKELISDHICFMHTKIDFLTSEKSLFSAGEKNRNILVDYSY